MKLFDEIPYLENERIILRKICRDDKEGLKELINDDGVYQYLPTFLYEKQEEDIDSVIDGLYGGIFRSKESLFLGIFLNEPDKYVELPFCGLAEFYVYKDSIHNTCIGYRLIRRFWGRGIASEAVSLMVDYLYSKTDIEIITASTMIENKASAKVLTKNGFIMTATSVPEDWGFDEPTIADKWFR